LNRIVEFAFRNGAVQSRPMAKPTKKKTRLDIAEIARGVVEQAIGERLNGAPLPTPDQASVPKPGSAGGKVGGVARSKKLDSTRRSEIARKAANQRWGTS
jgi:hypothetical protein